jgi:hypothetical protein
MTTNGLLMLTFTPLLGMSAVVLAFLEDGKIPAQDEEVRSGSKFVIMATWDDAPHLTAEAKAELWGEIPPHQRDARAKGVPQLGAGAIFPVPEDDLIVPDFDIPVHWPRAYGMDVGWNATAAVWGAWDRDNDVLYLTAEYKRAHAEPQVNAENIKARGPWMTGAIDPASMGSSQKDGTSLFDEYANLGLRLEKADNAVEAGLHRVWTRMTRGRLRVFQSLQGWLGEYRIYRRDEHGRVVKEFDHLMDATRYLVSTLPVVMREMPVADAFEPEPQQGIIEWDPWEEERHAHP